MPPPTETPRKSPITSGIPDPYEDAPAYLRYHQWKPLGIPDHPLTCWLDPLAPRSDKWEKKAVFTEVVETGEDGKPRRDEKGKVVMRREAVMANDGYGKYRPVVQSVFTARGVPIPLHQALQIQMERDFNEQQQRAG